MTTLRQSEKRIAGEFGGERVLQGRVQDAKCEALGGHIRISSAGGPAATGTSCWRCGVGLAGDYRVRVVDSIAAAQAQDAADQA